MAKKRPITPSSTAKVAKNATKSADRSWILAIVVLFVAVALSAGFKSPLGVMKWGSNEPKEVVFEADAPGLWLRVIRAGSDENDSATRNGTLWINEAMFNQWTEPKAAKGRFMKATTGATLLSWSALLKHAKSEVGLVAAPVADAGSANKHARGYALEVLLDPPHTSTSRSSRNSKLAIYGGGGASSGGSSTGSTGSSSSSGNEWIMERDGDGGVPFVWPPRAVGHRVELADLKPYPRGKDHPVTLETLTASPKVFYVHNFLSDEEAEALVSFAQDTKANPYALRPSTTGHKSWTDGGEASTNSQRTSLNGFDVSSPTSAAIKRRAFALAKIDPYFEGQSDGIQVLKYAPKQAYVPHTDYFAYKTSGDHNWDSRNGGTNRFATVFLYLSDVEAGGETVFPKVAPTASQAAHQEASAAARREVIASGALGDVSSWESKMTQECGSRFAVPPKKGDALLFYSQGPDGTLDPLSLHGGCPVLNGTKWAANVWIWNGCRYSVCQNLPKK